MSNVLVLKYDLSSIDDPVPIKINITIDDFVIKNLATFEVFLLEITTKNYKWLITQLCFLQTQLAHLDLEGLGLELNLTLADLRVIFDTDVTF